MELDQILRLKGSIEALTGVQISTAGQTLAAAYPRFREEVRTAMEDDRVAEFDRLFPEELASAGQPWGAQAGEAQGYLAQMAGWLQGVIDGALLERRIQAEAEAKARQVAFSS